MPPEEVKQICPRDAASAQQNLAALEPWLRGAGWSWGPLGGPMGWLHLVTKDSVVGESVESLGNQWLTHGWL